MIAPGEMDDRTLRAILEQVHEHTGITMSESKRTLLQGRLRGRLRELSLSDYQHYVEYLRRERTEVQEFINLVTTNETSFFRTKRIWDFFQQEYLPEWYETHPASVLRAWSAAASTGEEAYSIALSCVDFKRTHPGFRFQINASDISAEVLATAANAEYGERSVRNLKALHNGQFTKYFEVSDSTFRLLRELKGEVQFSLHNLFKPWPRPQSFDIVFLRNVLIYFEASDQEKVLQNVFEALVPGGLLIIGESESLSRLKTKFLFKAPQIYERGSSP